MIYHPNPAQVQHAARLLAAGGREGTPDLTQRGYFAAEAVTLLIRRALDVGAGNAVSLPTVARHMAAHFEEHPSERGYYHVTETRHAR